MRVAVVHDWLYTIGGAERVLCEILRCYPSADVFALFDFLTPADRARLGIGQVRTSFLQEMPFVQNHHRLFLPLMPIAIEQFDLSGYDLVISSSYAVAKGILTSPDQVHVAYIPRLRKMASQNVSFVGYVPDAQLRDLMATARAFVFAAEEDFGIIPVEALSEGTPVLALARGGVRETVTTGLGRRTGMFFLHATPDEIAACVRNFVAQEGAFSADDCRMQASRFSARRFREEFKAFIDSAMTKQGANPETAISRKSA